jgi:hypothetical protein
MLLLRSPALHSILYCCHCCYDCAVLYCPTCSTCCGAIAAQQYPMASSDGQQQQQQLVEPAVFAALQQLEQQSLVLALEQLCFHALERHRARPPPSASSSTTSTTTLQPSTASNSTAAVQVVFQSPQIHVTQISEGFLIDGLNSYQRMLLHKIASRFQMKSTSSTEDCSEFDATPYDTARSQHHSNNDTIWASSATNDSSKSRSIHVSVCCHLRYSDTEQSITYDWPLACCTCT